MGARQKFTVVATMCLAGGARILVLSRLARAGNNEEVIGMYESRSIRSRGGGLPALADHAARGRTPRPYRTPHTLEQDEAIRVHVQSSSSSRRTLSGPPPPGGPMALLDAYHDQLKEAVQHATERGFVRSWGDDGQPQVKVLVGPRDERGRAECLLVLQAQAAFDFAWRMYDWAMGQKRDAERARDGSLLTAPRRRTSTLRRAN